MLSAHRINLPFSFPIWMTFISFLVSFLWLGLPLLGWIQVEKVVIFVFFLTVEEMSHSDLGLVIWLVLASVVLGNVKEREMWKVFPKLDLLSFRSGTAMRIAYLCYSARLRKRMTDKWRGSASAKPSQLCLALVNWPLVNLQMFKKS